MLEILKKRKEGLKIILGVIIFFSLLPLMVNFVVKRTVKENERRGWYVKHLKYDFSAKVDTAFVLKQNHGYGRMFCTPLVINEMDCLIEDSISQHLNRSLRFIWQRKDGQVNFLVTNGQLGVMSDSIYVNSRIDKIQFFKDGKLVGDDRVSLCLEP